MGKIKVMMLMPVRIMAIWLYEKNHDKAIDFVNDINSCYSRKSKVISLDSCKFARHDNLASANYHPPASLPLCLLICLSSSPSHSHAFLFPFALSSSLLPPALNSERIRYALAWPWRRDSFFSSGPSSRLSPAERQVERSAARALAPSQKTRRWLGVRTLWL